MSMCKNCRNWKPKDDLKIIGYCRDHEHDTGALYGCVFFAVRIVYKPKPIPSIDYRGMYHQPDGGLL